MAVGAFVVGILLAGPADVLESGDPFLRMLVDLVGVSLAMLVAGRTLLPWVLPRIEHDESLITAAQDVVGDEEDPR